MDKGNVILGIDPGSTIMGYSLVWCRGKDMKLKAMGVVRLEKYKSHYKRLHIIHHKLEQMIKYYKPMEMAIEAPFYGKNVQSMLKLGRAQGVAISAAMQYDLPVFEYAPRRIKQSITGNGNASKEQVAAMVKHLIEYEEDPSFSDATDALATAICHQLTKQSPLQGAGKSKSWEHFIKQNPDRLD